jgi:hypothetical protein
VKPTDNPFWQAVNPRPRATCCLAGAAVADRNHVLSPQHIFRAGQFQHQCLVQRWQRQEVEAVEAFDRREPRLPYAALDHPAFPVDQLEFGQPQQIADMIDAVAGTLPRQLVVLAQEVGSFSAFR